MFRLLQKDKILSKDSESSVYVKNSKVSGKGLFTWRSLDQGTVIFKLTGTNIHHDYSPEFSAEGPNWIGVGYQQWIMPKIDDKALYLNHSCEPNVIFSPGNKLISLKPIEMFEELLLDYSTTELDPYWQMECRCSAKSCRKIIRSFQFLPPLIKKKYQPLLHPHFSGNY